MAPEVKGRRVLASAGSARRPVALVPLRTARAGALHRPRAMKAGPTPSAS